MLHPELAYQMAKQRQAELVANANRPKIVGEVGVNGIDKYRGLMLSTVTPGVLHALNELSQQTSSVGKGDSMGEAICVLFMLGGYGYIIHSLWQDFSEGRSRRRGK